MRYDPNRHHRRSIRIPAYDYAQPGAYFVTICTDNHACLFDDPVQRSVAETQWQAIPRHWPNVTIDAWVVMPNHIHGIIVITHHASTVGARHSTAGSAVTQGPHTLEGTSLEESLPGNASPLRGKRPHGAPRGSLGAIIANFKSVTARRINRVRHTLGARVWQRDYYEHVVRGERGLQRIRTYIVNNPARWDEDTENPYNRESRRTRRR